MTGTTRRKFFGLLAAAPIAAPMIAQDLAKQNYWSGRRLTSILDFDTGHIFQMADGERINWFPSRMGTIKRLDGKPIRFAEDDPGIPNRLYGTQINADGDAV